MAHEDYKETTKVEITLAEYTQLVKTEQKFDQFSRALKDNLKCNEYGLFLYENDYFNSLKAIDPGLAWYFQFLTSEYEEMKKEKKEKEAENNG